MFKHRWNPGFVHKISAESWVTISVVYFQRLPGKIFESQGYDTNLRSAAMFFAWNNPGDGGLAGTSEYTTGQKECHQFP
jgi:hypothetical protein